MSKFVEEEIENPFAFIQYKNTSICIDFHCECGAFCHFDGYFAYCVKCPHCGTVWEMPCLLIPRKADEKTYEYHKENPKMLEPDEELMEIIIHDRSYDDEPHKDLSKQESDKMLRDIGYKGEIVVCDTINWEKWDRKQEGHNATT